MKYNQFMTWKYLNLATLIISCVGYSTFAHPQNYTSDQSSLPLVSSSTHSKIYYPQEGERMGEWLSSQFSDAYNDEYNQGLYYENGLVWNSKPESIYDQQAKKNLLSKLDEYNSNSTIKSNDSKASGLLAFRQWIASLPATGRVVLPKTDPRFMQVNPYVEPVFQNGDTVKVFNRPKTITVLFDDTQTCQIHHQVGVRAKDYIDTCHIELNTSNESDVAYLISPDGTVSQLTLAKWNEQYQLSPNAGAWIWVPHNDNKLSEELRYEIAEFIASQGLDLEVPYSQSNLRYSAKPAIELKAAHPETSRNLPLSSSDWGVVGLLQTPTARMHKQGTLVTHVSHVDPYTQYNFLLQPFDWLETTVRYTNIDDVSYGAVSPDQDLKDKSIDVKLKLLNEDRFWPEIAVGWRDPAGTSLFGGEYVVANKRYGDFDVSLGMGWGYLGARGNIDNPLGAIDDRFEERVEDRRGQGGELSPKSWFTGPASLFGGLQWHTPYDPLTVKIEYDGNDYKSERFFDDDYESKDVPVNVGLTWQNLDRGLAISAGYERGDTLMFGMTLQGDLSELGQIKPKAYQAKNIETTPRTQYSGFKYQVNLGSGLDAHSKNASVLNAISQATGWSATDLYINNGYALLNIENYGGVFTSERLQEGMKILSQVLPEDTKFIQIKFLNQGEPIGAMNIDPETWAYQHLQLLPPSQKLDNLVAITSSVPQYPTNHTQILAHKVLPRGTITFRPTLQQSIGGPDGYLYGIFANAIVDYHLWQGSWIDGTAQVRVLDNYENYEYTADSQLPRVRTNIKEYMTTSRVLMPNLQLNQYKSFGNNIYGLAYAGYLDPMYAGVGAEVLYRQPNKSWALGADINYVRQREFDQHFGLRDYDVTTGNVSLYWDMPWYDVDMKLSAGQYLAGDKGATLDLSRQFDNGVKMGGWLTKTDVTSEEFGEGSLDKGIYVSIPLDTLFSQWSSGDSTLIYQPLIRDGGAKLNRRNELIDLTAPLDNSSLELKNPMSY